MATRKQYMGLLGGALILAVVLGILAPAAQASPYAYVSVLGSLTQNGTYSNVLAVPTGTATVWYKMEVKFADFGATNPNPPSPAARTLSSLTAPTYDPLSDPLTRDTTVDGIGSLWFNLYQQYSANNIQVNFATTASSRPVIDPIYWGGAQTNRGTITARTGAPAGYNNLMNMFALDTYNSDYDIYYFWGVSDTGTPVAVPVAKGSAVVKSMGTDPKADSLISASYLAPTGVNNGRIRGWASMT
jgi:hypothetical protein